MISELYLHGVNLLLAKIEWFPELVCCIFTSIIHTFAVWSFLYNHLSRIMLVSVTYLANICILQCLNLNMKINFKNESKYNFAQTISHQYPLGQTHPSNLFLSYIRDLIR